MQPIAACRLMPRSGGEVWLGSYLHRAMALVASVLVTIALPTDARAQSLVADGIPITGEGTFTIGAGGGVGWSALNGGSITGTGPAFITTIDSFGFGATVESGGKITLFNGSTITTTGDSATGFISEGPGSAITASNVVVKTSSPFASGIVVRSGATVTVMDSTLTMTGPNARALHMIGPSDGLTQQTAKFTNSALSSAGASAINIEGGTANVSLTMSSVIGNGLWLDVRDAIDSPAVLHLTADSSILTGAAITVGTSTVILQNGTIWNLTGDSNLTNLTNDKSLIDFSPRIDGLFKTLTVVNYIGAGGTIGLNTFLGSDLDGVVQGTWYDMKGQSTRFPALETDGFGFAASLESGVPFRFAGG